MSPDIFTGYNFSQDHVVSFRARLVKRGRNMITETALRQLGFTQAKPDFWRYAAVGKAIHFRVHFNVTADNEGRLAECNTKDPTTHLYNHFDVNGRTMDDPEFRDIFQRWKDAHGI
jgi:hypothetical protein